LIDIYERILLRYALTYSFVATVFLSDIIITNTNSSPCYGQNKSKEIGKKTITANLTTNPKFIVKWAYKAIQNEASKF